MFEITRRPVPVFVSDVLPPIGPLNVRLRRHVDRGGRRQGDLARPGVQTVDVLQGAGAVAPAPLRIRPSPATMMPP